MVVCILLSLPLLPGQLLTRCTAVTLPQYYYLTTWDTQEMRDRIHQAQQRATYLARIFLTASSLKDTTMHTVLPGFLRVMTAIQQGTRLLDLRQVRYTTLPYLRSMQIDYSLVSASIFGAIVSRQARGGF